MQHIKHYSLGLLVVLALLLGALISAQPALAKDGTMKGNGTQESPYQIEDAKDLLAFAEKVNGGRAGIGGDPDACAVLTANINLEGSKDNQWTPIGTSSNPFTGTFDGGKKPLAVSLSTTAVFVRAFLVMSVRAEL